MRERGRDEEGEDECCERPEWPIEVGRGREVSGRVCWREGIEGVDTTKEYLKRSEFSRGRERVDWEGTDSFGVDVEMVLIVVDVPEGCVASVRDVACDRTFRCMLLIRKK